MQMHCYANVQAQLDILEHVFVAETRYPDVYRREQLQLHIGVAESRIQVVFYYLQN